MHVAQGLPHTESVFWKVVWDQTRTARRRQHRVLPAGARGGLLVAQVGGHRGPEGTCPKSARFPYPQLLPHSEALTRCPKLLASWPMAFQNIAQQWCLAKEGRGPLCHQKPLCKAAQAAPKRDSKWPWVRDGTMAGAWRALVLVAGLVVMACEAHRRRGAEERVVAQALQFFNAGRQGLPLFRLLEVLPTPRSVSGRGLGRPRRPGHCLVVAHEGAGGRGGLARPPGRVTRSCC